MKVYVSADMEGISGILLPEHLFRGEELYQEGRRLLTREVNAVVEGLLQGGAKEIYVKDSHGTGVNFVVEELHPAVMLIQGGATMDKRFPGFDASFDAVMLIGYHAMAGTAHAVRDHTFSSKNFLSIKLNGIEVGEIAIDALHFGMMGVPVIFVSGDDKTCMEAKAVLGNEISTYETKQSLGQHYAMMKPPKLVWSQLPSVVASCMRKSTPAPYRMQGPYELEIEYSATELADRRGIDGIHSMRISGRTVLYKGEDLTSLLVKAFQ